MSYLHRFIRSLSHEELLKVRAMPLAGREREVMEYMLAHAEKALPGNTGITSSLGMTPAHFYKLSTVLLNKCYALFSPEEFGIFTFLNRKGLDELNHHEIFKTEKKLLKKGAKETLERFYWIAFLMFARTNFSHFEPEKLHEWGGKYLAATGDTRPGEDVLVEITKTAPLMQFLKSSERVSETANYLQTLDGLARGLAGIHHPRAHFELFKSYAFYYTMWESNPGEALKNLQSALEIYDAAPDVFKSIERAMLLRGMAEAHVAADNFGAAYDFYDLVYNEYHDAICTNFYHLEKFTELAILTGKFTRAEELVKTHFEKFLKTEQHGLALTAALLFAKLYLTADRPDEAIAYINQGMEVLNKSLFFHGDVQLRNLQNAYFVFKNDHEMAENLARRNIKFLQAKNAEDTEIFTGFFKIILAVLKMRQERVPFPKNLEEPYEIFQKGAFATHGKLLEKMRYGDMD